MSFKVYVVGGWVRDKLLGLNPNDKDYVVVGSTPEEKKIDYSTIEISSIKPTKLKIWSELYGSRKTFS